MIKLSIFIFTISINIFSLKLIKQNKIKTTFPANDTVVNFNLDKR